MVLFDSGDCCRAAVLEKFLNHIQLYCYMMALGMVLKDARRLSLRPEGFRRRCLVKFY